jgi:hypothetical protein
MDFVGIVMEFVKKVDNFKLIYVFIIFKDLRFVWITRQAILNRLDKLYSHNQYRRKSFAKKYIRKIMVLLEILLDLISRIISLHRHRDISQKITHKS